MKMIPNRCFAGNCKWRKQGPRCVVCTHPERKEYHILKAPCSVCGRQPAVNEGGCGACIGRGIYVYPHGYDECDCGGYEQAPSNTRLITEVAQ